VTSSSRCRLLFLEVIVFSVTKSVLLGRPSPVYMESPESILKRYVLLFSEDA
jgi:hypothetical protein